MKLLVPTSLEDITIEQYQKYLRISKLDDFDEDVHLISIIAIFCNISVEDAIKIEVKDLKEIANKIVDVLSQQPRDIQVYNNFGRIPNFDNITAGEYIDLDKYMNDVENIHRAMAVLYRPIKKKIGSQYVIEDYNGTDAMCGQMLQMPIELYLSANVFFYNLSNELLKATKNFLAQQPTEVQEQLEETLAKNGVGINQFTQLLEDASLTFQKSITSTFTSSFTF